jgi:hypothetical protein
LPPPRLSCSLDSSVFFCGFTKNQVGGLSKIPFSADSKR